MGEELLFSKIVNQNIFVDEYATFIKNNVIGFSKEGIAVLYGPNGTGKTSLVKVFSGEKNTSLKYSYNGIEYNDESQFYIINDQNNRNIINGTAKDFLLGDNIKKEFELQEYLAEEYTRLCNEAITMLKSVYGISSSSSKSIECFSEFEGLTAIIKDLTNRQSKGSKTGIEKIIKELEGQNVVEIKKYDEDKLKFLIEDMASKASLIKEIEAIDINKLTSNTHIKEIEENTEAIKILNNFNYKEQCIVCDTENINVKELVDRKTKNRENIIKTLDSKTKKLIEKIIDIVSQQDPFNIKQLLLQTIETGELSEIVELKNIFSKYKEIYISKIICDLYELFLTSDIKNKYDEYNKIISEKPEIAEEDFLYIEEIINNSMNKKLQIIRDDKRNIKIVLEEKDFLGFERNDLPLSTGEQNFLSLTFEFLKAKNSEKQIVVLDDPISSFDSIYKNKIAYAIVKILQTKKRIILTHNVDLLRLLEGQFKKCFKLYLFNNTEYEENGFIALNFKEQDMLINLEKLLYTFRNDIYPNIIDVKLYLVSMIPFMRGYASLINNLNAKEELTQLMHGYKIKKVNLGKVYIDLFGNEEGYIFSDTGNKIPNIYEVCIDDILNMTVDGKEIIMKEKYPLLNKTLIHSFTYLFLRLQIEKKLVEKYRIDTNVSSQLGQIISKAFPDDTKKEDVKYRVMLTSKKTLLNEFNHFEGNMSIFQPAIDITDHMLGKEKTDILSFVNSL